MQLCKKKKKKKKKNKQKKQQQKTLLPHGESMKLIFWFLFFYDFCDFGGNHYSFFYYSVYSLG